jgi:hypothetical protein
LKKYKQLKTPIVGCAERLGDGVEFGTVAEEFRSGFEGTGYWCSNSLSG